MVCVCLQVLAGITTEQEDLAQSLAETQQLMAACEEEGTAYGLELQLALER